GGAGVRSAAGGGQRRGRRVESVARLLRDRRLIFFRFQTVTELNPVSVTTEVTTMIRLHQYPPMFGIPNPSPFCMKLETWLRMTNTPFEVVRVVDPRKGPKGKVPWIDDRGKTVADSAFIIEHLRKTHGDPLDAKLDAGQRATSLALRRLIEEHL